MIKAELKQRWGAYCDTDKLVDDAMALLTKYHHNNTESGVCSLLDTYFENKLDLIEMFMKSESYIGNMRIRLNVELERRNNSAEIKDFCRTFPTNVDAKEVFLKYVDERGRKLDDYTRVGFGRFKAKSLLYGDIKSQLVVNQAYKAQFEADGATKESHQKLNKFGRIIKEFQYTDTTILSECVAEQLTQYEMNATFVGGMRTSRAFNRVCANYGVDKLPNYNRLFAQYADMVSGLKRKVKFYISLNPLDYLTMSFGNSWSSCHTIDKDNERGMPNSYRGQYCGGTMSYMLDKTSIITFVHSHPMENYEDGKLYRNMFHYDNGTLIQGRIYPQGNDGATDLYREFRGIVQEELSRLLELNENYWMKKESSCGRNTATCGVHYEDYLNYSECNVTYPREMSWAAHNVVRIGHERICPYCGYTIDDEEDSGYLTHDDCGGRNEW
jgi:hypothetical protein